MTKKHIIAFLLIMTFCIASQAKTVTLSVGQRLYGYRCKTVNLDEKDTNDPKINIWIYEKPSESSRIVGAIGGFFVEKYPPRRMNNFVQVMLADYVKGWVKEKWVRSWYWEDGSKEPCVLSIRTDGSIGYGTLGSYMNMRAGPKKQRSGQHKSE